jgi:hypothetical protein
MEDNRTPEDDFVQPIEDPFSEGELIAAWEEIEDGRYMPRRVRGSCHGRELG